MLRSAAGAKNCPVFWLGVNGQSERFRICPISHAECHFYRGSYSASGLEIKQALIPWVSLMMEASDLARGRCTSIEC